MSCERQVRVVRRPGLCALRDWYACWRWLHLKHLCDFHVCKVVLEGAWFLMLTKMTPHKSIWDVKFLYILYINRAVFSAFIYHALTYYYYVKNEHERSIFSFSVYQSRYFTEFHGIFQLEDETDLYHPLCLNTTSIFCAYSPVIKLTHPESLTWLPWKEFWSHNWIYSV